MHLGALDTVREMAPTIDALPDTASLPYEVTSKRIPAYEKGKRDEYGFNLRDLVRNNNTMFAPMELAKEARLYTKEDFKNLQNELERVTDKYGEDKLRLTASASYRRVGVAGAYDASTNTIRIPEYYAKDEHVLAHEIVHAQVVQAVANPTAAQRPAVARLNDLFAHVQKELSARAEREEHYRSPYGITNAQEFIAEGLSNPQFQYDLSRIKYDNTTAWDKFVKYIADLLGLKRDNAFTELLTVYSELTGKPSLKKELINKASPVVSNKVKTTFELPESGVLKKEPAPSRPRNQTKTAEPVKDRSAEQLRNDVAKDVFGKPYKGQYEKTSLLKKLRESVGTYEGRENLRRNLQNISRPLKILQTRMRESGFYTAIYDKLMGAASRGVNAAMALHAPAEKLRSVIAEYAKRTGFSLEKALQHFHLYAIARGEREYRELHYALNAPMDDTKVYKTVNGKDYTAYAYRQRIADELAAAKGRMSKDDIKNLRDELNTLAKKENGHITEGGKSPTGKKSTDIDSAEYNVVGPYTKAELANIQDIYNEDYAKHKDLIDEAFKQAKDLQELTKTYNREANFHSPQVDNYIDFYRRENYMPFRGDPAAESYIYNEYDPHGKRLSGSYNDVQPVAEGRSTDSENPFMQTISEAYKSAGRYGRAEVPDEVANLIKTKYIPGTLERTVTFEERHKGEVSPELLQGRNRIVRYLPNGDAEVYKIADPKYIEAIKGVNGNDIGNVWRAISSVTSGIGQFHTFYNLKFPPYNFLRHALTSATFVGSDFGPKVARRYASSIIATVLNGGMARAAKVARMLASKNLAGIEELAKNDPAGYRELVNYIKLNGMVSYQHGMGMKTQYDELEKEIGKKGFITKKEQVDKLFEAYSNTFELASRSAGYKSIEQAMLEKAAKEGPITDAVRQRVANDAVAYTRQLFDYSEIGKYGREAGSLFMFLRPAMTTASRFQDALAPAFTSFETAYSRLPSGITSIDAATARAADAIRAEKNTTKLTPEDMAEATRRGQAEIDKAKEKFKAEHAAKQRNARLMMTIMSALGYGMYNMAYMMAPTDDQGRNKVGTDNMELWERNLRLPALGMLGKDNDYFQIPWGWGFGAFASMGAQIGGVVNGESTVKEALSNMVPVALEAYMPLPTPKFNPLDNPAAYVVDSVVPSFARPVIEYAMNVDEFGREIYKNRMGQFGSPWSGGENLPEMYRMASSLIADTTGVQMSPEALHFFTNSYIDGLSTFLHNITGVGMTLAGDRDFDPKHDLFFLENFIGKSSSYDAREYADMSKKVQQIKSDLSARANRPDLLESYREEHPNADMIVKLYNQQNNGMLKQVRHQINVVANDPNLSSSERNEALKELRAHRDWLMHDITEMVKQYD